jgi:uncharacterized membrane protein (DUF106 family)
MADERDRDEKGPEDAGLPVRPRPTPRQSLSRFILFFLVILGIFAMFDQSMSTSFGEAVGTVLTPVMGFGGRYPVITLFLAGLFVTTLSTIARHFFTPWIRMARMNHVMGALRKDQMEAFRKGNLSRVEKLRSKQREAMKEFQDIQTIQFKFMGYTMFFFIVFFTWLRIFVDRTLAPQGNLLFAVPWSNSAYFLAAYVFPAWVLVYMLLGIPFGQVIQRVLKYITFRRRLQELGVLTELTPPEDAA